MSGLLVYCSDYQCGDLAKISGDRWPDHIRMSELEALSFVRRAEQEGPMSGPTLIGTLSQKARRASER